MVLYLILPLVFYSLVTGVIALTLPLQALMCTLLGAAVTFPVLYYWPYRFDQARRGRDAAHTISVSGLPSHPYPFGNWNMFICQ